MSGESKTKTDVYRTGINVFIALAVLTIIEYFVGIYLESAVLLFLLALLKAAAIVQWFMHVYRLWRPEEEH